MTILSAMNSAKLGLFSSQSGLRTASHNISNVNTPGYSRQRGVYVAEPGARGERSSGRGVRVDKVEQVTDQLVERRLLVGEADLGRMVARDRVLPLVEQIFNDLDGEGLGKDMEDFFSAADTLANLPTNPVSRQQLLLQADRLATRFQTMSQALDESTLPVDQEITNVVENITNRLKDLRAINSEIIFRESTPQPALDLKDQRSQMVNELANMIDIQVIEQENGGVMIFFGSGQLLMDANYAAQLSRGSAIPGSDFRSIQLDDRDFQDVTSLVKSGQLRGLIEVRDEMINGDEGFITRMETFMDEFRYQVNRVHSQSVGSILPNIRTSAFNLGDDLTTPISQLVTDNDALSYLGAPPDMGRVTAGQVRFAYGSDPDNLTVETVDINPADDTIETVVARMNELIGLDAFINENGRLVMTAMNPDDGFAIESDSSGIMAAMGMGALFTGNDMADFDLNDELRDNAELLLGAARFNLVDSDGDGVTDQAVFDDADNSGARSLANVRSVNTQLFGFNTTLSSHYSGIVGQVGAVKSLNSDSLKAAETARGIIVEQRESISGVSLEEEMTNLIRFQRSFQAASKTISVSDELLKSIIEMV